MYKPSKSLKKGAKSGLIAYGAALIASKILQAKGVHVSVEESGIVVAAVAAGAHAIANGIKHSRWAVRIRKRRAERRAREAMQKGY